MKVTNVNLWRCCSEVLKVRLWPKIVKQALRSAHWTSSPRGPPLSTMALKCCPAVPARAPGYSNTYRSRVKKVMMGRTFYCHFKTSYPHLVRAHIVDPLLHTQPGSDPPSRHPLHSGMYEVHSGTIAVAEVLIQWIQGRPNLSLFNVIASKRA